MKRRLLSLVLSTVLCLSLSLSVFAGSSTTQYNSSTTTNNSSSESSSTSTPSTPVNAPVTVEAAAPGAAVSTSTVDVVITNEAGEPVTVSLTEMIEAESTLVSTIFTNAIATENSAPASKVFGEMMAVKPSEFFLKTIDALTVAKGADVELHNMGTVKTSAVATDAFGNIIASAGKVKNVTEGCLIMVMSVDGTGKVSCVEGVYDPITENVVAIFDSTPVTITVFVIA